jgi:hypothetical protein
MYRRNANFTEIYTRKYDLEMKESNAIYSE